jgi:YgiT-type zinc finger domain-containing protein
MICKHGETKDGTTTVTLEKDFSTIVFKDVFALVCDNCGEKYIDDTITRSLLKNATEIAKSGAEVDVRKFHIAA